jgi:hypothetical protein
MHDAATRCLRSMSTWLAASVALAVGCGGSSPDSPSSDAGPKPQDDSGTPAPGSPDAAAIGDDQSSPSPTGEGGSSAGDAGLILSEGGTMPSACAPTIPNVSWTSPYAAWSRGIPTDPSFFPIAVWLQGSWHATELAGLGINIYVGNNAGTDAMAMSDLAAIKAQGMYAIVGQDSVGLANKDDTTIVGWWMDPDEPDNAQSNPDGGAYLPPVSPSTLVTRYNAYKATDSTRPIYLGLGQGVAFASYEGRGSNPPAESGYVPASDIISFDIYPYNNCSGDANDKMTCGQFWLNASGIDNEHTWGNRNQAAWTDVETTVIGAGTSDGPTPVQTASEVWLSLIHGASGIEYFIDTWEPSFREDGIFKDANMVSAVTALNKEILSLAPELNSATLPDLVTVTSSNAAAPIDMMLKASGTSLYVFSAIARAGTTMGSFDVKGMTGNGMATVVGENRTISVTAGKFGDAFAANGVHIYKIDLAAVTCN